MELQEFLSLLASGLLVIALPIVIAAAIQHYRVMTQRLREGENAARWEAIERAVTLGVSVARQTGLLATLRERAVQYAQRFLDERGVHINVDRLADLVEAEVAAQIQNPTAPTDNLAARQALLQGAIQAAVLAAEQSGMKGIIQNVATEKKEYAMELARRYLREHGVNVADELLSGLIEAELLRLFLASRNELPGSSQGYAPGAGD